MSSDNLVHDLLARPSKFTPTVRLWTTALRRSRTRSCTDRSSRLAHALRETGVCRGDRVALYRDKSVEAVVGTYGVLKAGRSECAARRSRLRLSGCRTSPRTAECVRCSPVVSSGHQIWRVSWWARIEPAVATVVPIGEGSAGSTDRTLPSPTTTTSIGGHQLESPASRAGSACMAFGPWTASGQTTSGGDRRLLALTKHGSDPLAVDLVR